MKHFIPHRSKIVVGLAALVFTIGLGAAVAFADSIQCNKAKGGCSVTVNQDNGNLVITYNLTGLGGTTTGDFVVNFDVDGHARCKNNGGNCPSAANKFGATDQSVTGTFKVHNGTASGTITVAPQTGLNCPGNQQPIILDVAWTNITFNVEGTLLLSEAGPLNANPLAACSQ